MSFGTLESSGAIWVEVFRSRVLDNRASMAERIIAVPFTVPEHGEIEVASISSSVVLQLPSAEYELTFEHGQHSEGTMWANLYFRRVESPTTPRILRADAELKMPPVFVMNAEPA